MNGTGRDSYGRELARRGPGRTLRRVVARAAGARVMRHGPTVVVATALAVVATACSRNDSAPQSPATAGRDRGVRPALEALRSAFPAGNAAPLVGAFADDVQLHSPALIGPEYRGRDVVASIVTPAMRVLEDVRVIDLLETGDGVTGGLLFDARVGDQRAQGFVLLRTKGEKISEITLLLRPLPALRAFVTRMGELGAQPAIDARKGG